MKVSPQLKLDLQKLVVLSSAYILLSLFMAYYNSTILYSDMSLGFSDLHEPRFYVYWNFGVGILASLLGAPMFIFVNTKLFRKKSFQFGLLSTSFTYLAVFLVASVIVSIMTAYDAGLITFSSFSEITNQVWKDITSGLSIVYFLVWGFVSLATIFMLQVNDKFGPGVLGKFLIGKYTQPRLEKRVFMFLDMKSSTTIAEQIGSANYFRLLRDCFSTLTIPIIDNEGEIYQYVGDEIVISWPTKKGFRNANCMKCFSDIKKSLSASAADYFAKYGVVPEFKAGIHYGTVTVGEIGEIKKDIVYSGDVLNTASRLQSLCNQYNTDLIVSDEIIKHIGGRKEFKTLPIGYVDLRGKSERVKLNSVTSLTGSDIIRQPV